MAERVTSLLAELVDVTRSEPLDQKVHSAALPAPVQENLQRHLQLRLLASRHLL